MALRPVGIYLLTGSALYTQTRTTYHLTEMASLASQSSSLSLLAAGETEASSQLSREAAVDSEEGIEFQSESIESESSSEREAAEAAEEALAAERYEEEAEALLERSAKDALESESSFARSERLAAESETLEIRSGQSLAASEVYGEQSAHELGAASAAERSAEGASARAAKDHALATERGAESARDGEALLKTEATAAEEAEGIAACELVPFLNVACDIFGAVTETGYQLAAAVEAAKSAVESAAAAAWTGREREELAVAAEKHEEAARDVGRAEEFHVLSMEEGEKAEAEKGESAALKESSVEAESLGEEELARSKEEEVMAEFDEEEALRHSGLAAEHEALAVEEEAAAIASQTESEERFSQSTAEEFEAQSERLDAKAKENKARKLMERSLGHAMNALGFVLSSILTAAGIIYIILMKTMVKRVVPMASNHWRGEQSWSTFDVGHKVSEVVLHAGVLFAVMVTLSSSLTQFETGTARMRWSDLLRLAAATGATESILIRSIPTTCCCWHKGEDPTTIVVKTGLVLAEGILHGVPVVLIELLILLTLIGPGLFNSKVLVATNCLWVWMIMCLLAVSHAWFFKLRPLRIESTNDRRSSRSQKSISNDWEEDEFIHDQCGDQDVLIGTMIDKEYGSMEEVSLLSSMKQPNDNFSLKSVLTVNAKTLSASAASTQQYVPRCKKSVKRLFRVLHWKLDLLALSLMVMLLYHSTPVIKVLHPFVEKSFAALSSLLSTPVLIAAIASAVALAHLVFVR